MVQLILLKNKFFEIENILIFTVDNRINESNETTYFNGTIRNISEFKFILKRIGVME